MQKVTIRCLTVTQTKQMRRFRFCWGSHASSLIRRPAGRKKRADSVVGGFTTSCQLDICRDRASQICASSPGPHLSTPDKQLPCQTCFMMYSVQSGLVACIKISGESFFETWITLTPGQSCRSVSSGFWRVSQTKQVVSLLSQLLKI